MTTRRMIIHGAGPGVTVQDRGRPGHLAQGLSAGGALDHAALAEGEALLGQANTAALEMIGAGGSFEVTDRSRIALTGAPMKATLEGQTLAWNASHEVPAGARLTIGGMLAGQVGYLHIGGGIATQMVLGARATHLGVGIGRALVAGDSVPIGADMGGPTGLRLPASDRLSFGELRILSSVQTDLFSQDMLERLEKMEFQRDPRSNRMALRLICDGSGFAADAGLSIVSEVIVPGDIQITGDGVPVILLAECQTTGGYPRIATVLPCDLPRAAQAPLGATLRLRFVTMAEAMDAQRAEAERLEALPRQLSPLVRDPRDIPDLLSYHLIDGAVSGHEEDMP